MKQSNSIGWHLDNSYQRLPDGFYTTPRPASAQDPKLIFLNKPLAASLGLNIDALQTTYGIDILAGNELPKDGMPFAQAYSGHQFGLLTTLGDGRAIMLGEQITPQGKRIDIQLKGAGRTVYSRGGDGLASLGPVLREYLISEAMYALGIPTTRGLAVIKTSDSVFRDKQYPRGILARTADSHLRIGTFQHAVSLGTDSLKELANYTIKRHYPQLEEQTNPYLALLEKVTERHAALIANWQLVGFVHGVMNTDNMTISGETIDYGPCAFMNTFDTDTVFSSIDTGGRYKYGNQPAIAQWNLARFAETLLPLIHHDQADAINHAKKVIENFFPLFNHLWLEGMRAKLGLYTQDEEDFALCADLLNAMETYQADYTDTFLALTYHELDGSTLFSSEEFANWHRRWSDRLQKQYRPMDEVRGLMLRHNPALIPRNHLVEDALGAAVTKNDYSVMEQLLDALSNPYAHTSEQAAYRKIPIPDTPFQTFCGT